MSLTPPKKANWLGKYAQAGISNKKASTSLPPVDFKNRADQTFVSRQPASTVKLPNTKNDFQLRHSQDKIREITKKEFDQKPSTWDIISHPATALGYKLRGQPIPNNFEKGETNPYDMALDVINPATYLNAAGRTAKNLVHPINTIKTLGKAEINAISSIPFPGFKSVKALGTGVKISSKAKNKLIRTAVASDALGVFGTTSDMTDNFGKENESPEAGGWLKKYKDGGMVGTWLKKYEDGGVVDNQPPQKYVIQKGDTLSSIAKNNRINLNDLQTANNIDDPNKIKYGNSLNIPFKYDKPLKKNEIVAAYHPNRVIDDYSPNYNYIVQGDKVYYSGKNKDYWVDISENQIAKTNLYSHLKNKFDLKGYSDEEKQIFEAIKENKYDYSESFSGKKSSTPKDIIYNKNVYAPVGNKYVKKSDAQLVNSKYSLPLTGSLKLLVDTPSGAVNANTGTRYVVKNNTISKAPNSNVFQEIGNVGKKAQGPAKNTASNGLSVGNKVTPAPVVSKVNTSHQEIRNLFSTASDAAYNSKIREVNNKPVTGPDIVESSINGLKNLWQIAKNGISRKIEMATGKSDDLQIKNKTSDIPMSVDQYYKNNNNNVVNSYDVPGQADRQFRGGTTNLNTVKFKYRNRGDYKEFNSDGLDVTIQDPFLKPSQLKIKDDATVIGVDSKGNFVSGQFKDFKNNDNVFLSKTFVNRVTSFDTDVKGNSRTKPDKEHGNSNFQVPITNNLTDDGRIVKGSLNVLTKPGKEDFYGSVQGGRFIIENPDTKKKYLVSGSLNQIKENFAKIKGNSKYANIYALDNGTYSRGLSYKDKKFTSSRLKSYDNENTGGGNGLYIDAYQGASPSKFKTEYFNTPNVRTAEDDSYKKGHALKNEVKNIVLHYTAYGTSKKDDANLHNQYMTKGNDDSHSVILADGTKRIYASPEQVTFHAGVSSWKGRKDVNDFSIGVEFQNPGKGKLTESQVESGTEYISDIMDKYGLKLSDVITHGMIAPGRKHDMTDEQYKQILDKLKQKGYKL